MHEIVKQDSPFKQKRLLVKVWAFSVFIYPFSGLGKIVLMKSDTKVQLCEEVHPPFLWKLLLRVSVVDQ